MWNMARWLAQIPDGIFYGSALVVTVGIVCCVVWIGRDRQPDPETEYDTDWPGESNMRSRRGQ